MKKLDAIDKLTDFLATKTDWNTDNGNDYTDAERIIDFLVEELGMSPPSKIEVVKNGAVYGNGAFGVNITTKNEWESEDNCCGGNCHE